MRLPLSRTVRSGLKKLCSAGKDHQTYRLETSIVIRIFNAASQSSGFIGVSSVAVAPIAEGLHVRRLRHEREERESQRAR